MRKTVQLKGKAELAKAEEPKEGHTYVITGTEEVKTQVQGFGGIRVNFDPVDAKEKKRLEEEHKEVAAMLWIAEVLSCMGLIFRHFRHQQDRARIPSAQKREVAGVKSKLGSFLDAFTQYLGDEDEALNTDNWKGKKIRIVSWKAKAREVAVLD